MDWMLEPVPPSAFLKLTLLAAKRKPSLKVPISTHAFAPLSLVQKHFRDGGGQIITGSGNCSTVWPRYFFSRCFSVHKLTCYQQLFYERGDEITTTIEEEINCSKKWSHINLEAAIGVIEEAAASVTSNVLSGSIPVCLDPGSQVMIFSEPLGIIVGIAPWNSLLILGIRAVLAPIAAGNTAILKVRSPDTFC